jgi:hypothetical protein
LRLRCEAYFSAAAVVMCCSTVWMYCCWPSLPASRAWPRVSPGPPPAAAAALAATGLGHPGSGAGCPGLTDCAPVSVSAIDGPGC